MAAQLSFESCAAIGQEACSCHDANFVVACDIAGCLYGKPWCHPLEQSWHYQFLAVRELGRRRCHDANFVVACVTGGCRSDNSWYHQWRQSWHNEEYQF